MFYNCISLEELDLSYFNINKNTNITGMFSGCTEVLKMNIKENYAFIKDDAFKDIYFDDTYRFII